jgi:hypothetical protein
MGRINRTLATKIASGAALKIRTCPYLNLRLKGKNLKETNEQTIFHPHTKGNIAKTLTLVTPFPR